MNTWIFLAGQILCMWIKITRNVTFIRPKVARALQQQEVFVSLVGQPELILRLSPPQRTIRQALVQTLTRQVQVHSESQIRPLPWRWCTVFYMHYCYNCNYIFVFQLWTFLNSSDDNKELLVSVRFCITLYKWGAILNANATHRRRLGSANNSGTKNVQSFYPKKLLRLDFVTLVASESMLLL